MCLMSAQHVSRDIIWCQSDGHYPPTWHLIYITLHDIIWCQSDGHPHDISFPTSVHHPPRQFRPVSPSQRNECGHRNEFDRTVCLNILHVYLVLMQRSGQTALNWSERQSNVLTDACAGNLATLNTHGFKWTDCPAGFVPKPDLPIALVCTYGLYSS